MSVGQSLKLLGARIAHWLHRLVRRSGPSIGDNCGNCNRWRGLKKDAGDPRYGWCTQKDTHTHWDFVCRDYKTRRPRDRSNGASPESPKEEAQAIRRRFNDVGCPVLPQRPTTDEIVQYLRDKAGWEKLQPYGREMDAREWAANALECAAERIKAAARPPNTEVRHARAEATAAPSVEGPSKSRLGPER